jgi:hypothetical protein
VMSSAHISTLIQWREENASPILTSLPAESKRGREVPIHIDSCGPLQQVKNKPTERLRGSYIAKSASYSTVGNRVESLF